MDTYPAPTYQTGAATIPPCARSRVPTFPRSDRTGGPNPPYPLSSATNAFMSSKSTLPLWSQSALSQWQFGKAA